MAVDVSTEILDFRSARANLDVHAIDGTSFPLGDGSVDVAFSDQLIEHLHPDDVATQLKEVRRVLAPNGRYVCSTPNRTSGPHDVSGLFEEVARGFHLREYDSREIEDVFQLAGFDSFEFFVGGRGHYFRVPAKLVAAAEHLYRYLPRKVRLQLRTSSIVNGLLGLNVVASARS